MEIQRTGTSISVPPYLLTIRLCRNQLNRALMLLSTATKRQSRLISFCGAPIKIQRPRIHLHTHKHSVANYVTPTRLSMTTSQPHSDDNSTPTTSGFTRYHFV